MITKYQLSCVLEFSAAADRDAAYTRIKTALSSEKATGKASSITMDKREFSVPENTSETL